MYNFREFNQGRPNFRFIGSTGFQHSTQTQSRTPSWENGRHFYKFSYFLQTLFNFNCLVHQEWFNAILVQKLIAFFLSFQSKAISWSVSQFSVGQRSRLFRLSFIIKYVTYLQKTRNTRDKFLIKPTEITKISTSKNRIDKIIFLVLSTFILLIQSVSLKLNSSHRNVLVEIFKYL